jgi:hypothetical protein
MGDWDCDGIDTPGMWGGLPAAPHGSVAPPAHFEQRVPCSTVRVGPEFTGIACSGLRLRVVLRPLVCISRLWRMLMAATEEDRAPNGRHHDDEHKFA